MSDMWKNLPFEECIEPVRYSCKVRRNQFLDSGPFPVISQEEDFINGYWDREVDLFRIKCPVVIFGDHTKVLKYVDFDFVLGADGVKILQPHQFLLPRFFYYRLQAAELESLGYARHYRLLKELTISFPSSAEQKRIVRVLDEAFEAIAVAKANAERNLQNARALFDSYLESMFSSFGDCGRYALAELLDKRWIEGHLDGNHGSDYPRKDEFVPAGVSYISANCIEGNAVDMTRAKHLTRERAARIRKGVAKDGDVLFAHNATVGPVALLRTDEEQVILGTSLTYYRCNRKFVLPEYLAHFMRSSFFRRQYLQVMTQSTRNQVPITKQREFIHVIPPIQAQEQAIAVLDALLEGTQDLSRAYEQKLSLVEELKKSLLHQAFTGKL